MTYYNTTSERGADLVEYQTAAASQEQRILGFFRGAAEFLYTPSQVRAAVFGEAVPLTSVRRAMTNLTDQRRLVKSALKRPGPYGRPEYCWHLKFASPRQLSMFPTQEHDHA